MLRCAIVLAIVLSVLALATSAVAANVTFGSPLNDPANTVPFQHGWDQTVFNTAGPVGIAAPQPGLITEVKLRGFAADGRPLEIRFRVVRPVGPGRWQAISTPLIATLPPRDGVHTYSVPNPRAFRVAAGANLAAVHQGFRRAGRRWHIFSANNGGTLPEVATDGHLPGIETGFDDQEFSPLHPVDQEGNSTVSYSRVELLLQAVERPDQCPGTDLPQQPCRSKLYLGARISKSKQAITYVWTVRNGGPHLASGLSLVVDLPSSTGIPVLPPGCSSAPGPTMRVTCGVGNLPPPQLGNAVMRISFTAIPHKASKHFRAVGKIEAPGVIDPRGPARHHKTSSTSTRGM